jgi:hypothetical protein
MTDEEGFSPQNQWLSSWIPRIAILVLAALWIILAATLPQATRRDLTVDVSCTSGNPVVAMWIESRSGGSGLAQEGAADRTSIKRYIFRQTFLGSYQVRVGCGGRAEQWGVTVKSSYLDRPYRLITCDDTFGTAPDAERCVDRPGR